MPELPDRKRQYHLDHSGGSSKPAERRYAELHCRTNFSFLEGASHPDELVLRATELGYTALAITDRNSLAGVVRAHAAARETGLKLLIGAEINLVDAPPVVLLATDRAAYGRLSRLITCGRRRAAKGECRLTFADVAAHAEGLIAGVVLGGGGVGDVEGGGGAGLDWRVTPPDPPFVRGGMTAPPLRKGGNDDAPSRRGRGGLGRYREVFGDRCYALAELHHGPDDRRLLGRMLREARLADVPVAAANDVYYHVPERGPLQDVLTATRLGCTVAEAAAAGKLFPNAERYLKAAAQMALLFEDHSEVLERTVEIAGRCRFSLDELRYEYPRELCPAEISPLEHLTRLTWEGSRVRYPAGLPAKVRQLIEHELQLIADLHYEAYFLTVWDLVRFARSRGILCQGRGSAANSVVCFCLGVTSVDPERIDVLFERFVSRERNEAPDIDVDFEHERREEVLQYLYEKYGRERAGMTAEVITYRPRSAVRDVGKALGLSLDRVDRLAKTLDGHGADETFARGCREAGLDAASPVGQRLVDLSTQLMGFPRHLSQHVGGMVITQGPLCELVPIENAAMPERTVIQWDKDDLDALGILKVDCLALGILTAIHRGFDLVERHYGRRLSLADVPGDDPAVYGMISGADTVGVFQIESRAQMSMLPRLRPRCFYDLVIEVAIVRPGPIQGDMVHPYLRRRAGLEPVEFPNEAVRSVLQKTLGVPIFQEQAMRLAIVAAGFTPGEADQLRRAMGAWRRPGVIEQFGQKLKDGMQANGYPAEFAERVFHQIRGFGEYGFPESHAASFALLVYVSAWLKHYYPAAFAAALLNSQPMGFYAPAQLVRDLQEHGGEVRPVDVNCSGWDCTLEETRGAERKMALRLGFRMLAGLSQSSAEAILQARGDRPFGTFDDFAQRTGLSQPVLVRLARADAFQGLNLNRRPALWQALPRQKQRVLFAESPSDEPPVELPPLTLQEEVVADYRTAGLSLRAHPISFIREELDRRRVVTAASLATWPTGRYVRVAGLVLIRQRPKTARGIIFMTLEDETGIANLIVRPQIWDRYRPAARNAAALLVHGCLERQGEVIHVMAARLEDLALLLNEVRSKSRDFR